MATLKTILSEEDYCWLTKYCQYNFKLKYFYCAFTALVTFLFFFYAAHHLKHFDLTPTVKNYTEELKSLETTTELESKLIETNIMYAKSFAHNMRIISFLSTVVVLAIFGSLTIYMNIYTVVKYSIVKKLKKYLE